jgi:hypothetical protein
MEPVELRVTELIVPLIVEWAGAAEGGGGGLEGAGETTLMFSTSEAKSVVPPRTCRALA